MTPGREVPLDDPVDEDNLLTQALADLERAKLRVRDLEGFVRIYSEYRRSGPAGRSLPPPPTTELAPITAPLVEAQRANGERPGVVLADPDLSITDAAAKVLRYFRQPMKARRLAETMLAWGFPYQKGVDELRASVGGVLARAVREQDGTFTKWGTGVFGLREWGLSEDAPDSSTGNGDNAGEGSEAEDTLFTGAGAVNMD